MSKYIKIDDAINVICVYGTELEHSRRYTMTASEFKQTSVDILESLPTIEVSEDCISREWVLDKIHAYAEACTTSTEESIGADYCAEFVEVAPSVVPSREEPKRGKWTEVEISEHGELSIVSMRCNQCGRYAYLVLPKGTKCVYDYCPWCKADMRGDAE